MELCACCIVGSKRKRLDLKGGCAKFGLIALIIVFMVCGAILFGFSIYLVSHTELKDYEKVVEHEGNHDLLRGALIIMIMVGFFVTVTAVFGFIGCVRNSRCFLYIFTVLMVGIIFVELAAAALAVYYKVTLSSKVRDAMTRQAHTEVRGDDADDLLTNIWSVLQYKMDCCGGKSHHDYIMSRFQNETRASGHFLQIPKSCCILSNDDALKPEPVDYPRCLYEAQHEELDTVHLHQEGCFEKLTDWLKSHAAVISGIGIGILISEIIAVWFNCILLREINRVKR